jgi:NAD(P)H-dependent FMN reductase
MAFNICVLYGSVREQRVGIRAVRFLVNLLKKRGHQVTVIDAKEENLPLLDKRYMDYPQGQAPANLERIAEIFCSTDAFVIVAGEYNFSIQPGLKNLLDYYYQEYAYRPAGIVSYSGGTFGGIRVTTPLRIVLGALGMAVIPKVYSISSIQNIFDEEGSPLDAAETQRPEGFLKELEWYGEALKSARAKGLPK